MLQNIGDSLKGKKFLAWLILIPLVMVFAIWGATGAVSLDFAGSRNVAASGDGISVDFERVNRIWQDELSRWQQQTGSEATPETRASILDDTLERLITGELIAARAVGAGYAVTERAVYEAIQSETAFQVEGRYSETLALARLAQLGLSADQYRADIRRDLQNRELQRSLFLSEFVLPGETGRLLALEQEQRQVAYATFSAEAYARQVKLTDEELRSWFDQNQDKYRVPEKVSLRYFVLSLEDIKNQVSIPETELNERYQAQRERFVEPERRKSRHILLSTEAEAKEVLAAVQAGADFAGLAKSRSKDTGSAAAGGDLGWADRAAFVKPFSDALFSMKTGDISKPVKSEFGYHIIKLEDVRAEVLKPLAEVRASLEEALRTEKASQQFGEREERLQSIVERQPAIALAQLAEQLGLSVMEMIDYSRGQPSPVGPSADFETVVFSESVLGGRQVSRPIAIGEDRLLVVQVTGYQPATVEKFEAVRERVLTAATAARATELARLAADEQVSRIASVEDLARVASALKLKSQPLRFIDRRDPSVPAKMRDAVFAFKRPIASKPTVSVVSLDGGDTALVVVAASRSGVENLDPSVRTARIRDMVTLSGQSTLASYIRDLREKADVEKNTAAFQ